MKNKKIVLITGCSSGFGLLTSKILSVDPSVLVYASMRDLSKKDNLLETVAKVNGKIELLQIDVTKTKTIKKAIKKIKKNHGKIDILINNAGHAIGGFFEDLSKKEIQEQFETNFYGTQNMIREVLPIMHQNSSGRIINISSIAGRVSYPALNAYNASKWALEGFSESLYLELKPFNIEVLLVEPGSFQTKIFEDNAKFTANYDNKNSQYYNYTKCMIETRIKKLTKIRPNPIKVAKLLKKLVHQKNPKFRTIIGFDAKITYLLKNILPYSLFANIVNFFALRKK